MAGVSSPARNMSRWPTLLRFGLVVAAFIPSYVGQRTAAKSSELAVVLFFVGFLMALVASAWRRERVTPPRFPPPRPSVAQTLLVVDSICRNGRGCLFLRSFTHCFGGIGGSCVARFRRVPCSSFLAVARLRFAQRTVEVKTRNNKRSARLRGSLHPGREHGGWQRSAVLLCWL